MFWRLFSHQGRCDKWHNWLLVPHVLACTTCQTYLVMEAVSKTMDCDPIPIQIITQDSLIAVKLYIKGYDQTPDSVATPAEQPSYQSRPPEH